MSQVYRSITDVTLVRVKLVPHTVRRSTVDSTGGAEVTTATGAASGARHNISSTRSVAYSNQMLPKGTLISARLTSRVVGREAITGSPNDVVLPSPTAGQTIFARDAGTDAVNPYLIVCTRGALARLHSYAPHYRRGQRWTRHTVRVLVNRLCVGVCNVEFGWFSSCTTGLHGKPHIVPSSVSRCLCDDCVGGG